MPENPTLDDLIKDALNQAASIGIITHIRPDGDAVGAALGLGLALKDAGKTVQMVLDGGISPTFRHLPGASSVKKEFEGDVDLIIVVDSADLKRTGKLPSGRTPDICIDHHITNEQFARINLVEPQAVATSAILTSHLPAWGLHINSDVAKALLTGILSDSIGFRTSNTSAESLRLAANLIDAGANINELYNKALLSRSYEATKYWGFGLTRLQRMNGMIWTSLSLEDRKASGYFGNDDADLTNILSSIDSYDVVILFVEQNATRTKVSWRARAGLDISELALALGGGGHPAAAGAELTGTLAEVEQKIIQMTQDYLAQVKSVL